MSERNRYVLAYDIRDDGRLRRVHGVASDFGDPLQYSVFLCDLSPAEYVLLKRRLLSEMDSRLDSVALIDLGPAANRGAECVELLGSRPRLPTDAARIW